MTKKLVLLNGATRGLGLEIVKALISSNDYTIVCFVRNLNKLSGLLTHKKKICLYKCDYSSIKDAINTENIFGDIQFSDYSNIYFINNIGVIKPIGKIGTINNQEIIDSLNINIVSNLIILNNLLKRLKGLENNTLILNISSGISRNPIAGVGLYGLAKVYLDYISKCIYLEKESNVQVFSFHPGGIDTKMQQTFQKQLKNNVGLKKFNYDSIYNQKLLEASVIAKTIIENYIEKEKVRTKLITNIYDYL